MGSEMCIRDSPMVVPFHDGARSVFLDLGVWTPHMQRRHEALLDREGLLLDAWPPFLEQHREDDAAAQKWFDWKQENLPDLPPIEDLPEDDASAADTQGDDA